jgi:hypothetical protein
MPSQLGRSSWQAARGGLLLDFALVVPQCGAQGDFQGATHMVPFDEEGIGYGKAAATGAVVWLQARLDKGEVKLAHNEQSGCLLPVLEALKVPRSSQTLVFSKTSFQRERISPRTPRDAVPGSKA